MSSTALRCPHCKKKLLKIGRELRSLQEENEQLARDLAFYHQGFVASSRRHHFHRHDCEWASYIMNSQNLIVFTTHEQAVDAGYKPCKTCKS